MRLLFTLVLALPFVLGAPFPDVTTSEEPHVTATPAQTDAVASTSTQAPLATTLPEDTVAVNTNSEPKRSPSKEHSNKKNVVDPFPGQYGYYDYNAYPYYYPQSYATYDYNPYAQTGYDYSGYYQHQKELANYDQALKEYEYKKYLYETGQTHLRPDLFPEAQTQQQQEAKAEKQIATKPQQSSRERQQAPTQRQQEFPQDSNWVTINDHKYQSQPQRADQPQYQTKKQAPRTQHVQQEETPEHRNNKNVQIITEAQDDYYPAQSNYYPRVPDKVIPNPPIRAENIEADVHGEVPDLYPYKQSPSHSHKQVQQTTEQVYEPQQNNNIDYSRRQREAYPQQHQKSAPAKQQAYPNYAPQHAAAPAAAPAPASYQHYRKPSEQVQSSQPQAQGYSRKRTLPSDENTKDYASYDDVFIRDTIGKRIMGKHGYLEDSGADWVVRYEDTSDVSSLY